MLIAGGRNDGGPLEGAELYELGTEDGGRIVGRFRTTGSMTAPRTAELYVPRRGTFTPTGSMHARHVGHTATFLDDGSVLIPDGSGVVDSAETYGPAAGTFTLGAIMTVARQGHTATVLNDGKLLIAGGRDTEGHPVAAAEIYDDWRGAFIATGRMLMGLDHACAVLLP